MPRRKRKGLEHSTGIKTKQNKTKKNVFKWKDKVDARGGKKFNSHGKSYCCQVNLKGSSVTHQRRTPYLIYLDYLSIYEYKNRPSFFFFFGPAHNMWNFPGQGLNLHHSNNPSHCSDSSRSLTHCTTGELPKPAVLKL